MSNIRNRSVLIAILAVLSAQSEGATSGDGSITLLHGALGGGGGPVGNAEGSVSLDSSVGEGMGGLRADAESRVYSGFIGQLYDVSGLAVTSPARELDEGESIQLGAQLTLDDDTMLALSPDQMVWAVGTGAFTGIDASGLAISGNVYVATSSALSGTFQGLEDEIEMTVRNVTFDDFGTYAADGIDDLWQVSFLGLDNTATNPDADLHTNLGEFFLNLNPVLPDGFDAVVPGFIEISGVEYQTLAFKRSLASASFVSAEVLRSTDLLMDWSDNETIEVSAVPLDAETEWVVVRSTVPTNGLTEEYLKLSVTATVDATIVFESLPFGFRVQPTTALADTLFGVPLHPSTVWAGAVSAVTANVFTLENGSLPGSYGGNTHEVLFTSGSLWGKRYRIASHTASSMTLDPHSSDNLTVQGLRAGDSFKIVPFWTLGSLFAGASGIPVTGANVLNPVSTVKLYDGADTGINIAPKTTYFYHDGSLLPDGAGWYDNDDFEAGVQDDVVLLPENFLVVRNSTAAAVPLTVVGQVPVDPLGVAVGRLVEGGQDSLAINPYPVPVSLGALGLVASGAVDVTAVDVLNPVDTVKLRVQPMGFNPAPDKTYFFHDGSLLPTGTGWYDNDNFEGGLQGNVLIPPGGSLIVRKGFGPSGTVNWLPPLPYTP